MLCEDTDHGYSQRLNTETGFTDHRLYEKNDNFIILGSVFLILARLTGSAWLHKENENNFKHNNLSKSIGCCKKNNANKMWKVRKFKIIDRTNQSMFKNEDIY